MAANECCICLEPLTTPLTTLKCGHQLHTSCLLQLADTNHSKVHCPLCRTEIFTFLNSRRTAATPPQQQHIIFINDEIHIVDREQEINHRKHIAALAALLGGGAIMFFVLAYGAYLNGGG